MEPFLTGNIIYKEKTKLMEEMLEQLNNFRDQKDIEIKIKLAVEKEIANEEIKQTIENRHSK